MRTLVDYLERQLRLQCILSNPPFEEPFEIVDDIENEITIKIKNI